MWRGEIPTVHVPRLDGHSVMSQEVQRLWLALNNGLARVDLGASVSYYDKTVGLFGSAHDVARHQGRFFVATSHGVSRLEPAAEGAAPRFMPRPGISSQCWSLLSTPQGRRVPHPGAALQLRGAEARWRVSGQLLHRGPAVVPRRGRRPKRQFRRRLEQLPRWSREGRRQLERAGAAL